MRCPFCASDDTKVLETRLISEGSAVKRRRECNSCNARFSTTESPQLEMPRIIKTSGVREEFSEDKLKKGFFKALEKRPVSSEKVASAITKIKHKLATAKDDEISSENLGNLVMDELKALDEVAYIRFASVYRKFKDIEAFKDEIEKLIHK
jgi:transcriptional repressor NrdR